MGMTYDIFKQGFFPLFFLPQRQTSMLLGFSSLDNFWVSQSGKWDSSLLFHLLGLGLYLVSMVFNHVTIYEFAIFRSEKKKKKRNCVDLEQYGYV